MNCWAAQWIKFKLNSLILCYESGEGEFAL